MFEFAKYNNISYSTLFKNLFDELPHTWNISEAIKKFYDERVNGTFLASNSTVAFDSQDEWKYFYGKGKCQRIKQ